MPFPRWLPTLILNLSLMSSHAILTTTANAHEARFYLGPYTKAGKSEGIYTSTIDTETGKLTPPVLAVKAKNPSFLAISPNGRFLYAAMEDKSGAVGAFAIQADGTLQELNVLPSGGAGACHVWVDATGRNVLVANYSDGSIAVLQTREDGSLERQSAYEKFTGSGPHPTRQKQSYGHAVYTDPSNQFVYACDLGADKVWAFAFDAQWGTLKALEPAAGITPPGEGPRHLAFHPSGEHVYVANELGLSVTHFTRNVKTGELTPQETFPTMPEGAPREDVKVSEIHLHPSGQWLYVSNRGRDTYAVYRVKPDGSLAWAEEPHAYVKVPRGFHIDPTGRWLISAGQDDDKVQVLKIDPASGMLTRTGEEITVGNPVCVLFAP
jgi:6-phosphogluconolactonase